MQIIVLSKDVFDDKPLPHVTLHSVQSLNFHSRISLGFERNPGSFPSILTRDRWCGINIS